MDSTGTPCPCGRVDARGRPFSFHACCGRWNQDDAPAPDAESLMRSRYSAYARGDEAYLLATWHASTRPPSVPPEPNTKWLGLDVRSHRKLDADHAEVEFVARFRVAGGKAVRLNEVSRFVREEGKWYYVDGVFRD